MIQENYILPYQGVHSRNKFCPFISISFTYIPEKSIKKERHAGILSLQILNSFMLRLSFIVKLIRSNTLPNIYAKKVFEMNLSYFLHRKIMCKVQRSEHYCSLLKCEKKEYNKLIGIFCAGIDKRLFINTRCNVFNRFLKHNQMLWCIESL